MDLKNIINNIRTVAQELLGVSEGLRAADKQRRSDMAALFYEISDCLSDVAAEIRLGNEPSGKCGEIMAYSEALPDRISKELGDKKAAELGDLLRSSYAVEALSLQLFDSPEKESELSKLEEASGKFRALGNIVKHT